MTDQELATLAYIFVHDWQIEVIEEARAELQDEKSRYRDSVSAILDWAKEAEFIVIADHAQRTLECIDADMFNLNDL